MTAITPAFDEDGCQLGAVACDTADLPMINAWGLWAMRRADVVADVELPDGTLPTSAGYRLTREEWSRYRLICESRHTTEEVPVR